jgi:hypothetical protein
MFGAIGPVAVSARTISHALNSIAGETSPPSLRGTPSWPRALVASGDDAAVRRSGTPPPKRPACRRSATIYRTDTTTARLVSDPRSARPVTRRSLRRACPQEAADRVGADLSGTVEHQPGVRSSARSKSG